VSLPPEEYIGPGTRRVWEAANELGLPFEKQYRHVDFSKCRPGCEFCNNGCLRGAKWTAREFARQAIENGASILTHTEVTDIIVEDGVAGSAPIP
jgi:choline dehydrogenase-like flavoprotein